VVGEKVSATLAVSSPESFRRKTEESVFELNHMAVWRNIRTVSFLFGKEIDVDKFHLGQSEGSCGLKTTKAVLYAAREIDG
jgi:hypothetical protein